MVRVAGRPTLSKRTLECIYAAQQVLILAVGLWLTSSATLYWAAGTFLGALVAYLSGSVYAYWLATELRRWTDARQLWRFAFSVNSALLLNSLAVVQGRLGYDGVVAVHPEAPAILAAVRVSGLEEFSIDGLNRPLVMAGTLAFLCATEACARVTRKRLSAAGLEGSGEFESQGIATSTGISSFVVLQGLGIVAALVFLGDCRSHALVLLAQSIVLWVIIPFAAVSRARWGPNLPPALLMGAVLFWMVSHLLSPKPFGFW